MSIDSIQASIQRQTKFVDEKYKSKQKTRKIAGAVAGAIWLGAGYLGAKSISKEKSILKDALSGTSNFVLKHLNNGLKAIDKKEKFTKTANLLQKAKDAPAKTKALVVFGAFIASRIIGIMKQSQYIRGVLNQARADEQAFRAKEILEDEAVSIAQRKELMQSINPAELLKELNENYKNEDI